jgi:hypothetical protein
MNQCYIAYQFGAAQDDEHLVLKIGFSKNPSSRFAELQAMSWKGPNWMEATTRNTACLGSEIERFLHDQLAVYRIHHEWFHVTRVALDAVKNDVWRRFGESFARVDVSDSAEVEAA